MWLGPRGVEIIKFRELIVQNRHHNLWGLFQCARNVVTNFEMPLFVLTLWGIWEARNRCLYARVKIKSSHIVARVEGLFQSFDFVQSVYRSFEQSNDVLSIEKWEVPPAGWYKLNVDAVVDKENGKVGYGAVICNSNGHVMFVGVDQGVFSDDVDIAEAEALRFSILLASETSLSPLMVKSDSLQVIQFISSKCHTRTKLFYIIS